VPKFYLPLHDSTALVNLGRRFSFLILYTVGRTPWTGDQRPIPTNRTTQTQNGFDQHIARQRLGKHVPTQTHAVNNMVEMYILWSAPRNSRKAVFCVVGARNTRRAVFSVWSLRSLYNWSLFVAMLVQFRPAESTRTRMEHALNEL
jgi:hypothetical protein